MLIGYGELTAGQLRGDLLAFKSVLARAEMNRNGDQITSEGIRELAATIPGMPLTYDDHRNPKAVCGHYIDARAINNDTALETTAVLYANRFPELTKGIRDGRLKQSVECHVTSSECLDCGSVYAGREEDDLCTHMMAGAGKRQRKVIGLAAFGGCLVANPAGTGCDIDRTSLRMLASVIEEEDLTAIAEKPTGHRTPPSEYGDVEYADEKNHRYPIDTEEHVRAALSYSGKGHNKSAGGYSDAEWHQVRSKIITKAEKMGIDVSVHAAQAPEPHPMREPSDNRGMKNDQGDGDMSMDKPTKDNPDPDHDGDDDTSPEGDTDNDYAGSPRGTRKSKKMTASKGLTVTKPEGARYMDVQCNDCGTHAERPDIVFAIDLQPLRDEIAVPKQKEVEAVAARETAIAETTATKIEFADYKAGIDTAVRVSERLEVVASLIGKDRAEASKEQIGSFSDEGFQFFVDTLKAAVPQAPKPPPMPVRGSFGVRGADAAQMIAVDQADQAEPKKISTFADLDFKYAA